MDTDVHLPTVLLHTYRTARSLSLVRQGPITPGGAPPLFLACALGGPDIIASVGADCAALWWFPKEVKIRRVWLIWLMRRAERVREEEEGKGREEEQKASVAQGNLLRVGRVCFPVARSRALGLVGTSVHSN
ncbi:uncharacterized protein LDX57_011141 [Aspergillus melleus]|uniref:uncharacterized protein n=1 Tax=Aspergillus melleus TaxID=138277 RepID=UPI001E8E6DD7|nr:uncharacterized protein LDX57_011141 [Aspergillus melleus]KAH8433507.1 hypothetical protein LDX57_011141 [Aspergillus melleus]